MTKIITYTNGVAEEITHFSTEADALTALALVGAHVGGCVDDTRIAYYDGYSGDKIVLEIVK